MTKRKVRKLALWDYFLTTPFQRFTIVPSNVGDREGPIVETDPL